MMFQFVVFNLNEIPTSQTLTVMFRYLNAAFLCKTFFFFFFRFCFLTPPDDLEEVLTRLRSFHLRLLNEFH